MVMKAEVQRICFLYHRAGGDFYQIVELAERVYGGLENWRTLPKTEEVSPEIEEKYLEIGYDLEKLISEKQGITYLETDKKLN